MRISKLVSTLAADWLRSLLTFASYAIGASRSWAPFYLRIVIYE